MTTIALAITHASHLPERKESFSRLERALDLTGNDPIAKYGVFGGAEPRGAWSEAQWTWALRTGADHCLFLQDDVFVAPNFWNVVKAMIEARPDDIMSLYSDHLAARRMALSRTAAWYSLSDAIGGPSYLMPRTVLNESIVWAGKNLQDGAADYLAEDDRLALFCLATGRRCYYPVISVADHDTELASTFGFAPSPFRRSAVTWEDLPILGISPAKLEDPAYWRGETIHLGRMHDVMPYHARNWVKGWTEAQTRRAIAERCPPEYDVMRWSLKP